MPERISSPLPRYFWIALLMALAGGILIWFTAREVAEPVTMSTVGYVQSDTCIRCHPGQYESWYGTYHRTMTQEASDEAIVGDFEDASYEYDGVTSRFVREDGLYFIETLDTNNTLRRFQIARTVGSRRVQQYVTRVGDRYLRLPLAWNISDQRWFHLNGAFLDPDGLDFNQHLALWDANCIFCHNVKADPGYNWEQQTFDSHVAELGIACEACHGPGEEHIARNTNPLRRYYLYLMGAEDRTIISPLDLPQTEQVQTCGHCHGQRIPNPEERIVQFLAEGDPYTPGEDLNQYTTPIWHDSELPGVDLTLRFWGDGTPRLTAYEYQGLMLSEGHWGESELTCISCHSMHDGDPKGMITEEMRGSQGCVQCHSEIAADVSAHTKHKEASTGSDCYSCHMPDTTYGLLDVHPTHRIQNPEPARAWRYDMPESCTLCHLDQSAIWAAESLSEQYGLPLPNDMPVGEEWRLAESVRALLKGDPVQRAVAIEALSADESYSSDPIDRLWVVPFLLLTMEKDPYPAVRYFAYRALKQTIARAGMAAPHIQASASTLPPYNEQANLVSRQTVTDEWQAWWRSLDKSAIGHPGSTVPLDAALQPIVTITEELLAQQKNSAISIGE